MHKIREEEIRGRVEWLEMRVRGICDRRTATRVKCDLWFEDCIDKKTGGRAGDADIFIGSEKDEQDYK